MRIICSSLALWKQLQPHALADKVTITIAHYTSEWGPGFTCTLRSANAETMLPVEARHEVAATVALAPLWIALKSIEEQPITLDLHAHTGMVNTLYAVRRVQPAADCSDYKNISFVL